MTDLDDNDQDHGVDLEHDFTVTIPPLYAGSLFVSDLATGLSVTVTSRRRREPGIPAGVTVVIPIQGSGPVGIQLEDPTQPYDPVNNPLIPIIYQRQHDGERTWAAGSSGSPRRAW